MNPAGYPKGVSDNDGDREIYGDYSVDGEDQPSNIEGLGDDDVDDELDRGHAAPDHWSPGQGYGSTPWEEAHRETIDQRRDQEVPEPDPYAAAEEDLPSDGQVGDARAGRLVDPDQGGGPDQEADLIADDVGIDGAAASAEEAAMHIVEDVPDE